MVQVTNPESPWWQRYILALVILLVSFIGILVLAGIAVFNKPDNAMTILNTTLPVFASWVGTILAFYFGRENFESANTQIREIIRKLTPEEMAKKPIGDIMRRFSDTTHYKIPAGKNDSDVKMSEIQSKCNQIITRLPIVNPDDSPKYIIHASSINKYLVNPPPKNIENITLAQFIEDCKADNKEFGFNKGFVVVSEKSTINEAKLKMEQIDFCQDIFITKDGTEKESLQGWVSNVRLVKYLQG